MTRVESGFLHVWDHMFEARGCQILQHTFARVLKVTFHDVIAPTKLILNIILKHY